MQLWSILVIYFSIPFAAPSCSTDGDCGAWKSCGGLSLPCGGLCYGDCLCNPGWSGDNCEICEFGSGQYGPNCDPCPDCGSSQRIECAVDIPLMYYAECDKGYCNDGMSGDGTCICNSGWTGPTCNDCQPGSGHFGSNCVRCVCERFWPLDGYMYCDDGILGIGCTCYPGFYMGYDSSNNYGCVPCPDCGVNMHCNDGMSGDGTCICNSGWTGATCTLPVRCKAFNDDNAAWPSTNHGNIVHGACNTGYFGTPTRTCDSTGNFGPITNSCQLASNCSVDNYAHAAWPTTNPGTKAFGACDAGWIGNPVRSCERTGSWSTSVSNRCSRITCPALTDANGNQWLVTNSLTTRTINCPHRGQGTLSRYCDANGNFGAITGNCTPLHCPAGTYGKYSFPEATAGHTVTGVCPNGYSGSPQRFCMLTGVWQDKVINPCTVNVCANLTAAGANYHSAKPGAKVYGTCTQSGYLGNPFRVCQDNGSFGPEQGTPCTNQRCPAETYAHASWPATMKGMSVPGVCQPGYYGSPTRICKAGGVWQTFVSNVCRQLLCPATNDGITAFPNVAAGSQIFGSCIVGTGRPVKKCDINGVATLAGTPCH